MAKSPIKYKFINNNSAEDTADILVKLLVAANKPMIDKIILNKLNKGTESHST